MRGTFLLVTLALASGTPTTLFVSCADASAHGPAWATPAVPPGDEEPTYAGGTTCAMCHPDEAERWAGSHHDLAMQPATAETVLGDFDDASFTHGGVTSRFSTDGERFLVETEGPDGELHEYEVRHTFGVDPLQQYLVDLPGGRTQVLGTCWDSRPADEGGQRWFHIYPDETIPPDDPLHWTKPAQTWNYMCAACHSTGLRKGYDAERDVYETTWEEIDVACEACHGPGSAHVDWATEEEGEDRGLVVALGDAGEGFWSFAEGEPTAHRTAPHSADPVQACARCHARGSPIREPYVPGRPLLETHRLSLLAEDLYHADGQVREEVYVYGSFLQSKMAMNGVVCTDCHDPHAGEVYIDGNALCARCHKAEVFDTVEHHRHEPGRPGAACVDCHMPASTFMVIDDRRDHGFRVPRPDLAGPLGVPNACNGCHADRSAAWAAEAIETWHGPERAPHFGTALHAGRAGVPGARDALIALAEDAESPGIARATAWSLLPRLGSPLPDEAHRKALRDEDALVRAAALGALEGAAPSVLVERAAPALEDPVRLVRIEAARILAPALDDTFPPGFEGAFEELLDSERANADRPESRTNLGNIEASRGDVPAAREAFLWALELDPTYVPAWANLAEVRRVLEGEEACGRTLREGLAAVPGDGHLLHSLGLHLVRSERLPEAVDALRDAAVRRPDVSRYAYAYAMAVEATGRPEEAALLLEDALGRHPYDIELLVGLATLWRDLGDIERARGHAERLAELLPDDPGVRGLLESLR
ncbi:MAG: tetratricopeptide repeat protein [Planctomycetota bacterium]|jgi:predicted CXXCH cytochrome family protein